MIFGLFQAFSAFSSIGQRFITRDPIAEAGGINLYRFVGNNPINFADPYGLNWFSSLGDALVSPISDAMAALAMFNGVADANQQLANNGFVNQQDLNLQGPNPNQVPTAGNLDAVKAGATACKAGTGFEMNALPLLATAGISLADAALETAAGDVLATVGEETAAEGGALRFSQTTASPWFSAQGDFAGQTISDVAGQLRAGTMSAADVPVQVVTMDGNTLIVNTRSSLALSQAGIPGTRVGSNLNSFTFN
ncbi:hypothetical protein SBV1_1780001 [Verrucomicrobia bacterium]|nr:hypothetical protein SBV1_1780001 [Verrucomicrobiota bacterium]